MTRTEQYEHAVREEQSRVPASGRATVRTVSGPRRVELSAAECDVVFDAELATPGYDDPRAGDLVLYFTDDAGRRYVVGVLRALRPSTAIEEALEASERANEPVLVHDKRGRLLFSYDPQSDRATLHVPDGDLAIDVPEGEICFRARDGVTIESAGAVRALSGERVELAVETPAGAGARVGLTRGEVSLLGETVTLAARRAQMLASVIGMRASRLESHVERIRQVADVIDTSAGRLVERARDAYREVERLSQHRAGRLKWVAETTATLVSQDALLKARDRMKIKGERIHLA